MKDRLGGNVMIRLVSSVLAMRILSSCRTVLLAAFVISSPAALLGDTVQFTVNPANTGTVYKVGPIVLSSSGLDGTVLAGQSLSLNLTFSDDVLARLFLSAPGEFGVGLNVFTNAGTSPGFAGATTGYLLDANGNQFGGSQTAGRAMGSDGTFFVGLVSFTSANLLGANAVDISGVHFDTTLPATGFVVTNAEFVFSLNGDSDAVEFGTAKQLPEPSSFTLCVIGLSLIALVVFFSGRQTRFC
jgi:hypothetical protein